MKLYQIPKEFALIIFGASGDLAKLKIFPALYSLAEQNRFPNDFHIIGFARSKKSLKQFRQEFKESIKKNFPGKINSKLLENLTNQTQYLQGDYSDKKSFNDLKSLINSLKKSKKITKLAYFSTPPIVFKKIIENLGKTYSKQTDLRLIIEKPFGDNEKSAQELFHFVSRYFSEKDVYLLDHYLGKSAVQSILTLRHYNRLLNLMLKGPEVANIQITASEDFGVHNRAGYFDKVGTIKDMFQSHLLQILALITMSIPITEDEMSIQREKVSILSALKFHHNQENIVLGQYEDYKKAPGIKKNSSTETFMAVRLFIDRESWHKTPIYIRTGKKLDKKTTYVTIELKKFDFQKISDPPNRIIFELQPKEKIRISLLNKHGESDQSLSTSDSIACTGDDCLPEHGVLLLDVFRKKRRNFVSFQEILATWKITDEILKFLKKHKKIKKYKNGSKGPKEAEKLITRDKFQWY